MPTTQSEDPNERVDHPRAYNAHPSGIECIDLIEHLPCNLANAVKYIWRCGLKQSETPIQELKKARWYTEREARRYRLFELDGSDWYEVGASRVEVVWHALAQQVIDAEAEGSLLFDYLNSLLLEDDFPQLTMAIDAEIEKLEAKT